MFIGAHESISKGVNGAIKRTIKLKGNAFQIFLKSPQARGDIKIKDDDIQKSVKLMNENNIILVVHSSYLLNFSKPLEENEWAKNAILKDLVFSEKLNAIGCIIHMGKHTKYSQEQGIKYYYDSINSICNEYKGSSKLILENSARQGTEIGYSIDILSKIYENITEENKEKIGFCIDTCHGYAAGYDFCDSNQVIQFFNYFDEKIGLDKLLCIHFNDSKKWCACCVDRHENIGVGYIGKDGLEGFKTIISYLKSKNFQYPIILETPDGGDEIRGKEINLLKEWEENAVQIGSGDSKKKILNVPKKK